MIDFKIKVTAEQSKIVQEKLFEKGYTWSSGDTEVLYLNRSYLNFWKGECEDKQSLTYCLREESFLDSHCVELAFEEFLKEIEKE